MTGEFEVLGKFFMNAAFNFGGLPLVEDVLLFAGFEVRYRKRGNYYERMGIS